MIDSVIAQRWLRERDAIESLCPWFNSWRPDALVAEALHAGYTPARRLVQTALAKLRRSARRSGAASVFTCRKVPQAY